MKSDFRDFSTQQTDDSGEIIFQMVDTSPTACFIATLRKWGYKELHFCQLVIEALKPEGKLA
jgi:hypothetical protein